MCISRNAVKSLCKLYSGFRKRREEDVKWLRCFGDLIRKGSPEAPRETIICASPVLLVRTSYSTVTRSFLFHDAGSPYRKWEMLNVQHAMIIDKYSKLERIFCGQFNNASTLNLLSSQSLSVMLNGVLY